MNDGAEVIRELLLPKLEAIKPSAGSYMARCPAHDDGKASLHVSVGKTQPVVLKCHAGCEPDDILAMESLGDALRLVAARTPAP